MNGLPADFIANFHFLRPLLLLALIPALLMVLLLRFLQSNQSSWHRAIDSSLLPYLLDRKRSPQQSWPLYGLLLLWVLGIVALAGPAWEQNPVPVQEREDALVIVLDLSLSMYAEDLRPNRAIRAQRKIVDILDRRRQEGQTGLVVYAGDAHAVTPMTDDVETINNLVPSLEPNIMPAFGSKPATGVKLALDLLANSALPQARILLLTDGVFASDVAAIGNLLGGGGHRLSVLGFGTEAGAPIPMGQQGYLRDANNAIVIPRLERGPLQQLAASNGGRYVDAQLTDADVDYLLEENLFADTENLITVERDYDTWNEAGPWLLLLALPLAALAFRRGWLLGIGMLVVLQTPQPAYALEWQDLWKRKDQQAIDAFSVENYADAAARFRDPEWRAAANYRGNNYEQVVQDLMLLDDPEAHYNRGNALARLGQYAEAIAAYDKTLAQAPDHADAIHNRELVAKLLEEQEQQQQKEQQNSEGAQQEQEPQDGEQQEQEGEQSQDQQQSDQQQEGEQSDEQQQPDQQNQEQSESEQENEGEQEQQQAEQQPSESQQPNTEEEQAMQQWLQRIPDDPGELLRNKFRYQSQQRLFQQLQNPAQADQQAAEQIW